MPQSAYKSIKNQHGAFMMVAALTLRHVLYFTCREKICIMCPSGKYVAGLLSGLAAAPTPDSASVMEFEWLTGSRDYI